jgi:hypothetical protein
MTRANAHCRVALSALLVALPRALFLEIPSLAPSLAVLPALQQAP